MLKLIRGILEYRETLRPAYQPVFAELARGQHPDALIIACADSRVVPNLFASAPPGDLFVIRNVANVIPPYSPAAMGNSEAAALEFAVLALRVRDIIVCGHSECGGMKALLERKLPNGSEALEPWLRFAEPALERFRAGQRLPGDLSPVNQLSQINVLLQMENVLSHPAVAEAVKAERLRIHGWWFDIARAEVLYHERSGSEQRFVVIDETTAEKLLIRFAGAQQERA